MRKVFFQMSVSLDGYFEGPNHELDWHVAGSDFNDYVSEMLSSLGGILLGRVTYQGFAGFWPTSTEPEADAMNRLPKYVFSRTLKSVEWQNSRLVTGDAAEQVRQLKREQGQDLAILAAPAWQ